MELIFDDQAVADLEGIFNWIAQDSPAAARNVTDRLLASIELLTSFPFMGHITVRRPGTPERPPPALPVCGEGGMGMRSARFPLSQKGLEPL